MTSSLGIGLGLAFSRPAASQGAVAAVQNVAARGQVPNGTIAASGSKTRMKGIARFTIGAGGALSLAPVFANFRIDNRLPREVDAEAAYSIVKAAISYEGVTVPLHFAGSRSVDVPPGAVSLMPDAVTPQQFGVGRFEPGYVAFVRVVIDLPATGNIAVQMNPMYLGGESQLLYDPAGHVDDIDGTAWEVPAEAEQWVPFPHPVMLIGEAARPVTSVIGIGDSIFDGSVDNAGDGSGGGGWARRAVYAANLPYLSISRTGEKAQYVAADHAKTEELVRLAGANAALIGLGNNDIRDGRSTEELLGDFRAIWGMLRDRGVAYIAQAQVTAETASTDQTTSLAGQTPVRGFGADEVLGAVNAMLATRADGLIDDVIDAPGAVQSDGKWNVPLYVSKLAAAAPAWSGGVSVLHAPEVGDYLSLDPETPAKHDLVWPHVTSVSGAGPFAVTLTGGPNLSHDAGALVRSSLSADGIHPQQAAHRQIAAKAAPVLRRIGAVRTPWIDAARSFEIDFVNRRAQRGGVTVPIESIVSCTRASAGKAFDGLSWSDIPQNALRYADGGGLFVEPEATNVLLDTAFAEADGSGLSPVWTTMFRGLTASYEFFRENGLKVMRLRLSGTATSSGSMSFYHANTWVPASAGQTWTAKFWARRIVGEGSDLNIQSSVEELNSAGNIFSGTYSGRTASRNWSEFVATRTFSNAGTVNARLKVVVGAGAVSGTRYDLTTDIAFPQLESGAHASSPVECAGAATTRAADVVVIALPPGVHDVTITYADGTTGAAAGVSGNYTVPADPARPVIAAIAGTSA
ncbi:hypothetical protein NOF55_13545 [Rhizobiaceae bacterium BDR2-2]|uniref:SGNH hydrolase-type esterase domain-containing protein n=1 Tax=Ectorhizobium quercum TaxID=2965071 RepID=A0AAE3N2K6_9HYPH|nr:SGNH/GDSL hydrolase family protein [Ectorhizobium quercum]MCX8998130.1 hypothetical protein [Ectorhizobium quercum]